MFMVASLTNQEHEAELVKGPAHLAALFHHIGCKVDQPSQDRMEITGTEADSVARGCADAAVLGNHLDSNIYGGEDSLHMDMIRMVGRTSFGAEVVVTPGHAIAWQAGLGTLRGGGGGHYRLGYYPQYPCILTKARDSS